MRMWYGRAGLLWWCWFVSVAHADGLQRLDDFLRNVQSFQGRFTQVVSGPPRQGEVLGRRKTSSGDFAISRPNKFRFDYIKPFGQNLVSDGQTLWVYDADLDQLSQRRLAEVMSGTPAVLMAGAGLAELEKVFRLANDPSREKGWEWVRAIPKASETTIQQVRLGFELLPDATVELRVIEVSDSFGQISRMEFADTQRKPVPAARFVFRRP
jgi:outer membrane lipoprotein carrier protein